MDVNSLIDLITALWLAFIGACVGSFLNVVAYRMPRGESVIWTPSHCPKCNHAIRAYDNVPVLGWLWLRGKCRDCGEPISPRYAIVEFVMGAMFFVLAYVELFSGGANLLGGPITEFTGAYENVWKPQWQLISVYAYQGFLLSVLMAVALIACDGQSVPKKLFLASFVVGLIAAILGIRRPLGIDGYRYLDWGTWEFGIGTWLSQAIGGAFSGWAFGALISAARRKTLGSVDMRDPILLAGTIVGLFLGYETLVYLFLPLLTLTVLARSFGSSKEKRHLGRGFSESSLLACVFALILAWHKLDTWVHLYGHQVPPAGPT